MELRSASQVLPHQTGKTISGFVHGGIAMLKQESVFPTPLPQNWKHIIVYNRPDQNH